LRALLLAALLLVTPGPAQAQGAIDLRNAALTLNPDDKAQQTVGRLRWRGGHEVTSSAGNFGALSDLTLSADGTSLFAVTDEGRWFSAELAYDGASGFRGLRAGRMGYLHDPAGKLLSGKYHQDAEALARLPDGSLLVAFERDHRLWRYQNGLDKTPQAFPAPPGLAAAGLNAGIEAMVSLADGRLLAFSEGEGTKGTFAAWLRETDGSWHDLALAPSGLFRPTGAALLPDGDVLLLERRFTLLGGLGARLSRIAAADVKPGALLKSTELAELRSPLTLDNFEGVGVHLAPDGSTRITLLSDDNFNPLQRTLAVQFELLAAP
jgi:hypothetical protein